MDNRYKQQIQTQTVAILIVLKSIGACRNTFSNYDVINSVSIDKTEFVSSFTNGAKETIRISAKFNERGSLNLETIQVKVSNKVVDVANLKQFPSLKEFKEIKTIERVKQNARRNDDYKPVNLLRDYLVGCFKDFRTEEDRNALIKEVSDPLNKQIADFEEALGELQIKYAALEAKYNDAVDDYGMMHDRNAENSNKLEALPANLCIALKERIDHVMNIIGKELVEKQPADVEGYIKTRSDELIGDMGKVEVKYENVESLEPCSWVRMIDLSSYQTIEDN